MFNARGKNTEIKMQITVPLFPTSKYQESEVQSSTWTTEAHLYGPVVGAAFVALPVLEQFP